MPGGLGRAGDFVNPTLALPVDKCQCLCHCEQVQAHEFYKRKVCGDCFDDLVEIERLF